MKRLILFGLLVIAFSAASGRILNVPDQFPTIQAGIDSSANGDTVLVAPGTYNENIRFEGHRITLGSLFLLTSERSYIDSTIIRGRNYRSNVVRFENGEDSTAVLTGFTLTNGWAYHGGGIFCLNSNPIIKDNIITGNGTFELGPGAGIFCERSSPLILNCVITQNTVYGETSALYSWLDSYPVIANCVFTLNHGYPLLYLSGGGTITNCILWGNDSDTLVISPGLVSFSLLGCQIQGSGIIYGNPQFRDAANGDFHLMSLACGDSVNSPCIDAGHPGLTDSLLNCLWGLGAERSDMGAFGGGILSQVGIEGSTPSLPLTFSLSQNYPNPFNPATTIKYDLPSPCRVRIDIYDILGRRVATLVDEEQAAGAHQAIWNAQDKSSGIYFYRIQAGEFVETKKMLLMK